MPSTTSSQGSETPSAPPVLLSDALGYAFRRLSLLELALRHRSWCAENGGVESNERLEFLGDAVLGLVITDHLYDSTPSDPEGILAQRRAELVNSSTLAELARHLDLGRSLRLGKGEEATGGRGKTSILADALEAVFGAVYLDGGLDPAREMILELFGPRISEVEASPQLSDHKSRLQEWAAREFGELPRYRLSESGPEHAKVFTATVRLDGDVWGRGDGRTKKEAEQAAAAEAFGRLVARQGPAESADPTTSAEVPGDAGPEPPSGDPDA